MVMLNTDKGREYSKVGPFLWTLITFWGNVCMTLNKNFRILHGVLINLKKIKVSYYNSMVLSDSHFGVTLRTL